jgi:2-keto-4-pentenoate hydratase/2-oxohepta-3-ene-1,7-dioic acid hydratase in catechol pathway
MEQSQNYKDLVAEMKKMEYMETLKAILLKYSSSSIPVSKQNTAFRVSIYSIFFISATN